MNKASLSRQPDASQLAGRVVSLQEQLRTIQQAIGAEALAAKPAANHRRRVLNVGN